MIHPCRDIWIKAADGMAGEDTDPWAKAEAFWMVSVPSELFYLQCIYSSLEIHPFHLAGETSGEENQWRGSNTEIWRTL